MLRADNDRLVIDLERQLEEARHELAQKRKDDKELRGHELKQNIQISGVSDNQNGPGTATYTSSKRIWRMSKEAWSSPRNTGRICKRCTTLNVVSRRGFNCYAMLIIQTKPKD